MDLGAGRKGLRKQYIFEAVEASLRRLHTDYIDLYQAHVDDAATPLEETLEAFAALMQSGKIRAIGASNYKAGRLTEAMQVSEKTGLPSYRTLQPLYNLYDRFEYEHDLAPVAEKFGLAVTPYFALASGFLTGKYRSEKDLESRARGERVRKYLTPRG